MSDGLNQGYSQYQGGAGGDGSHPTIAANVLDPKVNADAQKGGVGVGGTNEATVRDEAAEHIQAHGYGQDSTSTNQGFGTNTLNTPQGGNQLHGAGGSTTGQGYSAGQPNQGEPGFDQQHREGIDYLKGRSAAGNSGSTGTTAGGIGGSDSYGSGPTSGSQQYGSGATSGSQQYGSGMESGSQYGQNDSAGGARTGGVIDAQRDPATNTASRANQPTDSDVRTGGEPTDSADPTTADTARGQHAGANDEAGATSGAPTKAHDPRSPTTKEAAAESDGHGGPPSNIPLAGGERIGTKHWGESKIIPDNPPKPTGEGATDDATAANTAKNEGKHDAKAESGEHKEGLMDKVKDALHMNKK